jgi:hypothetical protein
VIFLFFVRVQSIDNLRVKMDLSSEQMFHELEQRHLSLRKEHSSVCVERDMAKGSEDFDI